MTFAERAVAALPSSADYRLVLGEAYLANGRFASAAVALEDCLRLKPNMDKAVLKLALAQVALGKGAEAQMVLGAHQSALAIPDYGLAMALAGDAPAGISAMETAVRAGEDTAKLRQNLALAYAFAGRWDEARVTASIDLTPDLVRQRLAQWAILVAPGQSMTQVSTLLGIRPQMDPGLPPQLGLAKAAPPGDVPTVEPAADLTDGRETAMSAQDETQRARFDVPPEVKDPGQIEARTFARSDTPEAPTLPRARRAPANFVVQIGAFRSSGAVAVAWTRSAARWPVLRQYDIRQGRMTGGLHRLSVGGFATRQQAVRLCRTLRAQGGVCFSRPLARADVIRWAARSDRPLRQLAMR
ncbi:MAG: SPOR domain-containing protein [Chakrabartia sp.]